MDRKYHVLFLSQRNSARSIMAEAILNQIGSGEFVAHSAGVRRGAQIDPVVVELLEHAKVATAGLRVKHVNEFLAADAPKMDFVFTLSDTAAGEAPPGWPGQPITAHWGCEDPDKVQDPGERRLALIRVRSGLERRLRVFVNLPLSSLDRLSAQRSVADLGHHISRRYDEELDRVRTRLLAMGGLVEQQLQKAVLALVEGDSSLGAAVAVDDDKVNSLELALDEDCARLLAMRAPTAGDLRVVIAIIKTVTDLERIGDEGEKVAVIAARLAQLERTADPYLEVTQLGRLTADMLHRALDAFARMDAASALTVLRLDHRADDEFASIQRQCVDSMLDSPGAIRRALDLIWIARALERVGDHTKNVCEYVFYMVYGEDVRHRPAVDLERCVEERR